MVLHPMIPIDLPPGRLRHHVQRSCSAISSATQAGREVRVPPVAR
jgi:hypothetical protein